jgi:hypothetical protein
MSVRQGNAIETFLQEAQLTWNGAWDGMPVLAMSGDTPVKHLPGGMRITVLSPRRSELDRLAKHWREQSERGGPQRAKAKDSEDDTAPLIKSPDVLVLHAAKDEKWQALIDRHVRQSESAVSWEFVPVEGTRQIDSARQTRLRRLIGSGSHVLLLVSAHMLASRTFTQQLLPMLEDSSESDRRFVTWALLEPCEWRRLPLSQVQAAHDIRKPLSRLDSTERDRVVGDIIRRMSLAAEDQSHPPSSPAKAVESINIEELANAAFAEDTGIANAASIAFLAEFNHKSLLIGGDARSDVLCDSIRSLLSMRQQKRLRLDAFVVPHGGSSRNLSRELLELLECDKYLVSTNGAVFQHPSRETIARIVTYGRATPDRALTLVFNYRSQFTEVWSDPELQQRYRYQAIYPDQPDAGIKVQI